MACRGLQGGFSGGFRERHGDFKGIQPDFRGFQEVLEHF